MSFNFNFNININLFGQEKDRGRSYLDYCRRAGYPDPFPQQIALYNYFYVEPWKAQVKLLLGSRGYGKTDYVTVNGAGHKLYKDPKYKILTVTKERSRGIEIAGAIRDGLTANGVKIRNMAKGSIILPENIGKDPNLGIISIRSRSLRGRHPDIAMLDDPITPDDDSNAERKRVKKTYEELLKVAKRVGIMGQPVHKLDLYQDLRGIVDTIEIRYGAIPELDVDLEAQRKAGVSEKSIQASYFLNIEDDLSMPFLKMKIVDYFPVGSTVAFIDPAIKGGKDRDCTALSIGRIHFDGAFVVAGFVFHRAWEDCLNEFNDIFQVFKPGMAFFEDNVCGSEPVTRLCEMGLPTQGHHATGNKHGRIMRMAIHADNIKLHRVSGLSPDILKANAEYGTIVRQYEYGADFDDAPDSLAGLMEKVGLIRN